MLDDIDYIQICREPACIDCMHDTRVAEVAATELRYTAIERAPQNLL
jgi:hypothetical protein